MPPRIPLDEFGRKRCTRCLEYKTPDLECFGAKKGSPDGLSCYCRPCLRLSRHAEYRRNPEKYAKYRAEKQAEAKEYARLYYRAKASVIRQKNSAYRQVNRSRVLGWRRQWAKNHPVDMRVQRQARRARRRASGPGFTAREWAATKARFDGKCLACQRAEPEIQLTPDHVVPLARGGSNQIANIQPLCLPCNMHKGTKIIDYRPH